MQAGCLANAAAPTFPRGRLGNLCGVWALTWMQSLAPRAENPTSMEVCPNNRARVGPGPGWRLAILARKTRCPTRSVRETARNPTSDLAAIRKPPHRKADRPVSQSPHRVRNTQPTSTSNPKTATFGPGNRLGMPSSFATSRFQARPIPNGFRTPPRQPNQRPKKKRNR